MMVLHPNTMIGRVQKNAECKNYGILAAHQHPEVGVIKSKWFPCSLNERKSVEGKINAFESFLFEIEF